MKTKTVLQLPLLVISLVVLVFMLFISIVGSVSAATLGSTDPPSSIAKKNCNGDEKCNVIYDKYLIPAINLLSAAVGIICVAMIIWGGIEFSSSGGDPQKVSNGKKHITNAIIALVAFLFLWAFLNFLIPGGVL